MRLFSRHEHPLCLREDEKLDEEVSCELCARSVAAPFYVCNSCKYYVHKSCGDLPLEITHSFHPSHGPLVLVHHCNIWCSSCYKTFKDAPFYYCYQCDFLIDVECAVMPPAVTSSTEGQKSIQHISHWHPLLLVEAHDEAEIKCLACKSNISSGLAYGCARCNYFLHRSCAEFPQEIQHPLHPHHGLLPMVVDRWFSCRVCEGQIRGPCNLSFKCQQCGFQLCWKCKNQRGIKYEDHEHLLCFAEEMKVHLGQCNGHDTYCRRPVISKSIEFHRTQSCVFRCLVCDFRVHLLCGPLPSNIKHEFHIHSLTLVDLLVEDDSGEYYCDVCEIERDPRIRIYYCKECKYFAHVYCVIPEIVNVLRGELGDVKLKTVGDDFWGKPEVAAGVKHADQSAKLTLKDLIDRLTTEEKGILERYYKWDDASSKDVQDQQPEDHEHGRVEDEEINEIVELSRFTRQNFGSFCIKLGNSFMSSNSRMVLKSSDWTSTIVEVKGYKIPYPLAGALEKLLNECGDIDQERNCSQEMRSFTFFILCHVLKRMHGTLVKDLTKHLLREWYFHLKFVRHRGVKIDFACAQLERLVHAYLGLQAERLEVEIPARINSKIAELQRCLDKCNEYRGLSEKSEYMKDCLKNASNLRWKNALEDLQFRHDEAGGGSPSITEWWWWWGRR